MPRVIRDEDRFDEAKIAEEISLISGIPKNKINIEDFVYLPHLPPNSNLSYIKMYREDKNVDINQTSC